MTKDRRAISCPPADSSAVVGMTCRDHPAMHPRSRNNRLQATVAKGFIQWNLPTMLNIPRRRTREWAAAEDLLPHDPINLRRCWKASSLGLFGDESPWAVSEAITSSTPARAVATNLNDDDPLSTKAALLLPQLQPPRTPLTTPFLQRYITQAWQDQRVRPYGRQHHEQQLCFL